MKRKKIWTYAPSKEPKTKPSELIKIEVEEKANELVRAALKPLYIQPPPENPKYN